MVLPVQRALSNHLLVAFSKPRHVATGAKPEELAAEQELNATAQYIITALAPVGAVTRLPVKLTGGRSDSHNLELVIPGTTRLPAIVIGAHYDTAKGTSGVNDNGSGAAALIELARSTPPGTYKRDVRFVFFTNEEEPFFGTDGMGSRQYVRNLQVEVAAMLSLETLLYYTRTKESQCLVPTFDHSKDRHDAPPAHDNDRTDGFLPRVKCAISGSYLGSGFDVGDFVAFVGSSGGDDLMRESLRAFCTSKPDIKAAGISAVGALPKRNPVLWSDHHAFAERGIPAIMVTDTAPLRYPYYHATEDSIDVMKNYLQPYARVVVGLREVIKQLAEKGAP